MVTKNLPQSEIRLDDGSRQFLDHLRGFSSLPFLFVGSGLSRRFMNLSNWESLLRQTSELTGRDFGYYYSSVDGDLPGVASTIAEDFHEVWWTDKQFQESRQKHSGQKLSRTSPYKIEVSKIIERSASSIPTEGLESDEINLLRSAHVDGIITTNYDQFLEELFSEFCTYIGQDGLLLAEPQGIGEIYKIHGCISQPETLVLTRADYQRFNDRNSYLAAKLLTMFCGTSHHIHRVLSQ